ncbi:MAG TPA: hypothetical protein VGD07_03180 [Methylomirabilota bacterium]
MSRLAVTGLALLLTGCGSISAHPYAVHPVKKPALKDFAVCEIVIADLLEDADVWVMEDHDDDFGDAHVLIMGISKRRVDWLCALGSRRIVKYPAPAKPPTADYEGGHR